MPAPLAWPRRKPKFEYPISPVPRTAVLIPGFRSRGAVRVFAEGWCAKAAKFAPQAIAATLAQFEAIAATTISVSHAIIVVGRWEDPRVTDADREKLWARFHVPLFEYVAENGMLLAAECEAHCGLHTILGAVPGNAGDVDTSPCECGKTAPRFIPRDPQEHAGARAAGL